MVDEFEVGQIRVTREKGGNWSVRDRHDLQWDQTKGEWEHDARPQAVREQMRFPLEDALSHAMDQSE